MEHLVLIVWSAIMAGTLAGGAVDQQREVPIHFPTVPVPAGDTLSAARTRTANRTFPDGRARHGRSPACKSDCGVCTPPIATRAKDASNPMPQEASNRPTDPCDW
jgi:hypothetical protein